MKCIVNKLSASVSDNTLPVFSGIIVKKNYIMTTQNDQLIDVSDIFSTIPYNKMKVEATVKYVGGIAEVLHTSSGYAFIRNSTYNRASAKIGDAIIENKTLANPNNDYTVTLDGAAIKVTLDGESVTGSSIVSSTPALAYIFHKTEQSSYSVAGYVKLKEVKVYNDNVLVAQLVPVTIDSVPCLYDEVNLTAYYEKNGGTLAVE